VKKSFFAGRNAQAIVRVLTIVTLFTAAALMVRTPAAMASDMFIEMPTGTPNFLGLGVGGYPDYFGSDDYSVGVAPVARIGLGGERYAQLFVTDLKVNLVNHRNWRLGPELLYRLGRKNVDDPIVDKMDDIDGSLDIGLFGGYTWIDPQASRKRAGFDVWGLWDVSGVHEGAAAGARVFGMYPVARPVSLAAGAATTWGSDNYTDTYFSVSSADSVRSGLPVFAASSGVRDVRGWLLGMFHLSRKWHLAGGVLYSRLVGDAADSPIVSQRGSENQLVLGAGLIYGW
jgi:outer membrane protein